MYRNVLQTRAGKQMTIDKERILERRRRMASRNTALQQRSLAASSLELTTNPGRGRAIGELHQLIVTF